MGPWAVTRHVWRQSMNNNIIILSIKGHFALVWITYWLTGFYSITSTGTGTSSIDEWIFDKNNINMFFKIKEGSFLNWNNNLLINFFCTTWNKLTYTSTMVERSKIVVWGKSILCSGFRFTLHWVGYILAFAAAKIIIPILWSVVLSPL